MLGYHIRMKIHYLLPVLIKSYYDEQFVFYTTYNEQ